MHWPIPPSTSIVIPAFNEGDAIAEVVARAARRRRRGTRSSSSTTDRPTTPATRAADAGATVVRHPYNKGNGAAVKSGIRRATGEFVLIVDGDGQHQPEDACRIVSPASASTTSSSARVDASTQATAARRVGNGAAQLAGQLSRPAAHIPDLTSGFRAARARVPARLPAPAAERLLDADDDHAGFLKAGYSGRVRADLTRGSGPASRRSASPATA